jgi:hypothetical protein
MGFELFVGIYSGGQRSALPRAPIRALFPVVKEKSQRDYWKVH